MLGHEASALPSRWISARYEDIATTVPSSARFLPRGVSGNTAATVNSPLWRLATPAAVIGIVLMQLFLVWTRRRKNASKTLCST